jgi:hypothetical protein
VARIFAADVIDRAYPDLACWRETLGVEFIVFEIRRARLPESGGVTDARERGIDAGIQFLRARLSAPNDHRGNEYPFHAAILTTPQPAAIP